MAVTIERLIAEIEADPDRAIRALGRLGVAIEAASRDRTATIDIDTKDAEKNLHSLNRATERNRASIDTLGGKVHTTSKSFQFLGIAMAGLKFGAIYTGATMLSSGLGVLSGAVAGLTATLTPLTGLLGTLPTLLTAGAAGIGAMVLGLGGAGKAVAAYTKAQEASKVAQEGSAYWTRMLSSGQRRLRDAHKAVAEAAKEVKQAEQDLAAARKEAARDLVEQRQDAILTGFAQTEAVLALEEAQDRLRKAQERTARGGKTLMQQTDDFTGKVYEVTFKSSADTEPFDMAGAQRDVIRAQIEVERAKHRNKTTQEDLNEAERKGIEGHDFVVGARKRIIDSIESQTRAVEALKDAEIRLSELQKQMADKAAGGGAYKEYAAQMKKLSQEGRDFVGFLTGTFIPAWEGFRHSAEKNLLPPLQEGLKAFLGLIPMLKKQSGEIAGVMGEGLRDFLKGVSTEAFEKTISDTLTAVQPVLKTLLKSFLPLTNVFLRIAEAAAPLTDLLLGKMVGHLERLSGWMDTVAGKTQMAAFFKKTGEYTTLWGKALSPLITAIAGVVRAADPLARWMLERMAVNMTTISDKANSIAGQTAMKEWFENLKAPLSELSGVFSDFIKLFFDPRIDNSGLTNTLKAIRTDFLPPLRELIVSLSDSDFGSAFVTFLGNLVKGVNALIQNDGPITLLIRGINELADALGWLSEKTNGTSTLAILGGLAALKGFKIGKGALDGLKGLFAFGKERGTTPANPLYVWTVNGGGTVLPGGKKIPKIAPVPVAAVAGLTALGVAGVKGVAGANSDQGRAQRDAIIAKQKEEGKDGALSGVNAWLTTALHHGIGSAPVIGSRIRKELNTESLDEIKQTTKKSAEQTAKAYTNRLLAILPPKVNSAGQQVNDNLSLGMQKTKHKLYEAANVMAKIPDDAFKFNRLRYQAAGKSAATNITLGLSNGKIPFSVRAAEFADIPHKSVTAKHPASVRAGKLAGESIAAGLNSSKVTISARAGEAADIPKNKFMTRDFSPLGLRVGTGIATGLVKSYAGISAALDALFLKLTQQSGDAAVATEKEIMRRTRATLGSGTGDGPGRTPPSRGSGSGTASAMARAAVSATGGRITSSYRTPARNKAVGGSPYSYHLDMDNPANDIVSPNMAKTFDFLYSQYGSNIREMIYGNRMVKNGRLMPYGKSDHWDHVHVAHDGGQVSRNWPTLPGLRSDERPAILQVGERVVPKQRAGGGGSDLTPAMLESMLSRVLEKAKPNVSMQVDQHTHADPRLLSSELAWSLR